MAVGEGSVVECDQGIDVEPVAIDPCSWGSHTLDTTQEPSTSINPSVTKQTSLIVSDDHVTPIPVVYDHEPAFHGATLDQANEPIRQEHHTKHEYPTSEENPTVVADYNISHKPTTLQQAKAEQNIAGYSDSVDLPDNNSSHVVMESGSSGKVVGNSPGSVDDRECKSKSPAGRDMATATKTFAPTKSAFKIPIESVVEARKAQRPPLKRYTSKVESMVLTSLVPLV